MTVKEAADKRFIAGERQTLIEEKAEIEAQVRQIEASMEKALLDVYDSGYTPHDEIVEADRVKLLHKAKMRPLSERKAAIDRRLSEIKAVLTADVGRTIEAARDEQTRILTDIAETLEDILEAVKAKA